MQINPLVSVIMPAYNAEKYLAESIESIINQSYTNWELIIVNDGSTDKTEEIIHNYQLRETRIRTINQQNKKQGAAKNAGIALSEGDYIAFLDADDLWLPLKLSISVSKIVEHNADLIFTSCYLFEKEFDINTKGINAIVVDEAMYHGESAIYSFLEYNKIPNLTVVLRKDILNSSTAFINTLAEDYDMWLTLLKKGYCFISIKDTLSAHRIHDGSITSADRHATKELVEIIKSFGRQNPGYKSYTIRIAREKIKHWLYHGTDRTNHSFRSLSKGVYPSLMYVAFIALSYTLPFSILKKIVVRIS